MPGSAIGIELWLPEGSWNGRYQQVGTHRFGGIFHWDEMAPQLRRGFATGATDNGHRSKTTADIDWALGAPVRIEDYGWRAVHELASKAKRLIAAYYGRPQRYAYFNGCSTGGREGLKSAQMFPGDFDGILAGGAAAYFTRAVTRTLQASLVLRSANLQGDAGAAALRLAQQSATAACDTLDGVKDGVISDPRRCRWDPHTIVCKTGRDPATCLSAVQATAIKVNMAPLRDPVSGAWLAGGLEPGSEPDQIKYGYHQALSSMGGYQISLNDPAWDGTQFDLHRDLPILERTMGSVNAIDPDLSSFKAGGGKLIQWHTWGDGAFTPGWTVRYYDDVVGKMQGLDNVQSFYRLFMMGGAGHCPGDGNGPGAAVIGGEGQTVTSHDPEHDAISALQAWVEKGIAPQQFVATKYNGNDPAKGIQMQRPVCPYPSTATYKGKGDSNDSASFSCVRRPVPASTR